MIIVMRCLSSLVSSVSFLGRSTPRTSPDANDAEDADGGNNPNTNTHSGGQVVPRAAAEPPFVVPVVAVVLVVVLVGALWWVWRRYDWRAQAGGAAGEGEGEGEVWTEMRRAGVALGVGIQDVRGDTWDWDTWGRERERGRRAGRVVEERWRAERRRVEENEGVVTSVGSKPKMWEVDTVNEIEIENERVKVSWLVRSSALSPDSLCGQPLTLGFNYELYIVRMPTPGLQPGPGSSEPEVVFGVVTRVKIE